MNNNNKQLIGINISNQDTLIGPIVISKLILTPDFFRKESWIEIKKNYSIKENNLLVERSMSKVTSYEAEPIPVYEITKERKEVYKAIISLLNTTLRFWEYEIYLWSDNSQEEVIPELEKVCPINLKKKLTETKIKVSKENNKVLSLTKSYSEYYLNKEMNEIRMVWGDFSTGMKEDKKTTEFIKNNPKCPHIRNQEGD